MTAFLNNLIFSCLTQHRSVFLPEIGSLGTVRIPAVMDEKGEVTHPPSYTVLYSAEQGSNRSVIDIMVSEYDYPEEEAWQLYGEWKGQTVTGSGGSMTCRIESVGILERSPDEDAFTVSGMLDHALNPSKKRSDDREHFTPPAEPVILPETGSEPETGPPAETVAVTEADSKPEENPANNIAETGVLFASETGNPDHSQPVVLPVEEKTTGQEASDTGNADEHQLQAGFTGEEKPTPDALDKCRDELAKTSRNARKWRTLAWIFLGGVLLLLAAFTCLFITGPKKHPVEKNMKPVHDTLYASSDPSAADSTAGVLHSVSAEPSNLKGYHVVGGAFMYEQNARHQAQIYKEAGLPIPSEPLVFYSAGKDLFIVSLGRYDREEEALAALNRLPAEQDPNKCYWILKYQ